MSSMLEQAIVDASALKEAAIKNAESAIIEHYSVDIKEAVAQLLEQPEDLGALDMDLTAVEDVPETDFAKQVPHGALEGENLCPDEDAPIEIDFDDLQARLSAEEGSGGEEMIGREEELAPELAPEEETELSLQESVLYSILNESDDVSLEELNIDELLEELLAEDDEENLEEGAFEPEGDEPEKKKKEPPSPHTEEEEEEHFEFQKGSPYKRDDKKLREFRRRKKNQNLIKENKQLLKSTEAQKKQITTLKEQNNKYRTSLNTLKEKLNEVNLSNAKLLYTNRVLNSNSLNERQKNKIVEAVKNAKTVEEAKTIFDTLQSAVGSVSSEKMPKSLSEVVRKRSSAFLSRKEEKRADPFAERMKILAGIKNN